MKFLLPTTLLLLFAFCSGQKNKPTQITDPKIYTDTDIITSSLLDKNGNLWFGTSTEGLYKYCNGKFSNFNIKNGLCTNQIWSIIEDNKGHIWLATNKGLCQYNGKTFTPISLPPINTDSDWYKNIYPTVNPNQASSMVQDKNGIFWIGTSGIGAYKYDGKTFENILANKGRKYEDNLHHNVVQSIIKDNNNHIWFASMSNGGIVRFNGETSKDFKKADGLSDNMVRCLYQDREGNIWIGTNGNRNGGLDKFDGTSFTNFNQNDGLCSNNIAVIFQSSDGKIWLGSDRETLCYYENGSFKTFDRLTGVSIRTILEDKNGHLWFGGRKGNLWKYDGMQLTDLTQLKNK